MQQIAILTDFGHQDPYVGLMKGVISTIAPAARITDLAHGVPPQDVLVGALWLEAALEYFPRGTIFLCVVDPGVGSDRRILAMEVGHWRVVLPDNGLVSAAAAAWPLGKVVEASDPRWHLSRPGDTFHGRDIMAPVAAWWSTGLPIGDLGDESGPPQTIPIPEASEQDGMLVGQVLYRDHYGNLITSIRGARVRPGMQVHAGGESFPVSATYSQVEPGGLLGLVGSTGRLELSVNGGDASQVLSLHAGDPVVLLLEAAP